MNWTHGYFASDGGYTYGTYAETLPTRLWFAGLLYGQIGPRTNFRYLDLGCGQGFNLLIAAALHPESEFVGVDFMPEHISHARRLAAESGLKNVSFVEADFLQLSENLSPLGGSFDYVVAHGITAWVSDDVSSAIYSIVSDAMQPGGIFYDSYNTMPGWLATVPFQHMVATGQKRADGRGALAKTLELFRALNDCDAAITKVLPGLNQRIDMIGKQDMSYVLQEYNNQHWKPKWVSSVIEKMSAFKLSYLGTATLTEAFDQNYPEKMRALFSAEQSLSQREQTRDLCVNQAFRRDLFAKGVCRAWPAELRGRLEATAVIVNPLAKLPSKDEPFVFGSGTIEVKGHYEPYKALLEEISKKGKSGITIGELATIRGAKSTELAHMVSLLVHGGWITLVNPSAQAAKSTVASLNRAIALAVRKGAPYRHVASASTGTAFGLSEIEMLFLSQHCLGKAVSAKASDVVEVLTGLGRQIIKEGSPVSDKDEQLKIIDGQIAAFEAGLEHWKHLGVI